LPEKYKSFIQVKHYSVMQRSVEILPWAHSADSLLHRALMRQVKKLPRGSEVFLEVSQDLSKFFGAAGDFIAGNKAGSTELADKLMKSAERMGVVSVGERHRLFEKSPQVIAYLEMMSEAKRRNLKLIPIETPVSRMKAVNSQKTAEEFVYEGHGMFAASEIVKADEFREMSFARQIRSLMNRDRKYFAIVGLNHLDSVNRKLRALRVVSKTNVEFVPKNLRAYVAQSRLAQRTARREFRKGNDVAVGKALLGERSKKVLSPKQLDPAKIARLVSKRLAIRNMNSEKRQKAKIMQKNARRMVK